MLNYYLCGMKDDKMIYELQANICKALAHPVRMQVIDLLREGEKPFGDLCEAIGCSKSNLSQHLSSMVDKGILLQRRDGLYVFYSLVSGKITDACRIMREVLAENLRRQQEMLENI